MTVRSRETRTRRGRRGGAVLILRRRRLASVMLRPCPPSLNFPDLALIAPAEQAVLGPWLKSHTRTKDKVTRGLNS
jgi:hypothetical protein